MAATSDEAKKAITWPSLAYFKGRSKQFIAELYIKKIEWHEDLEGAIDAIRLTLSDGSVSPKVGLNSAELEKSLVLGGVKAIRGIVVVSSRQKII